MVLLELGADVLDQGRLDHRALACDQPVVTATDMLRNVARCVASRPTVSACAGLRPVPRRQAIHVSSSTMLE